MNRRQILEAAAVIERSALWRDLASMHASGAIDLIGQEVADGLVARIKLLSEAIGYPSPWPSIPVPMLKWYEAVETDGSLGIYAEKVPWAEVDADLAHRAGVLELSDEDRDAIRRIKPFQPDWTVNGAT